MRASLVPRQRIRVAAEQNVGTATGHVGGDRNGAFASRLRHDRGFARVVLRVQNLMRHAHFDENLRQTSDFSTEMVPTSTGWPLSFSSLMNLAAFRNFSSSVR